MANWNLEIKPKKEKRKFYHFKDLIIHEDEQVIVVNKPAGLASLDERSGSETNLLRLGKKYYEEAQLCHRLDKNTSGVMLFAKNPDAYREISLQFQNREVLKHYVAIVHGARNFEEMLIEAPVENTGKGTARIHMTRGKEAATVVDTAELFRDFTLVNCHPITGRMHQIRLHLSSVGSPLLGDITYGGKDIRLSDIKRNFKPNRKMEESTINKGFMLHARGIRFRVPGQEEESMFVAPLPKEFEVSLKILRKYNTA